MFLVYDVELGKGDKNKTTISQYFPDFVNISSELAN